jgi:MYXO-CTERM domain-containing protein
LHQSALELKVPERDPMLESTSLSKSLRSFAVIAALAASSAVGGSRARAQVIGTGGAGGTAERFAAEDFFIALNGADGNRLTTSQVLGFFNLSRCNCQTPVQIYVALLQSGLAKRAAVTSSAGTVSIVLGADCNNAAAVASGACVPLSSQSVVSFLDQTQVTFQTDAQVMSAVVGAGADAGASGTCVAPNGGQFTQTINVNFDFDGDGAIDLSVPDQVIIDLAPPPAPTGVTVQPGSQALVVGWSPVPSSVTDLLGYQVLCSRADQYQVFDETATATGGATGPFTAAFVSCPSTRTGTGLEGADPTFVCSPLLSAGATSARIEILQDGITYAAAVVAVDQSGNAALSPVGFNAPSKTTSFYDTYRNGDPAGGAAGGLCAVGPAGPSPKQTWGGLSLFVVVATGLIRRRRRQRRGR